MNSENYGEIFKFLKVFGLILILNGKMIFFFLKILSLMKDINQVNFSNTKYRNIYLNIDLDIY